MTLEDPEVVELLAGEPELLAVADAVAATQRRPHRSRARRLGVRLIPVVAAAVALAIALLVVPQGNHGIVGRALAALGDGPILHIVSEVPTGGTVVDLRTGQRHELVAHEEIWANRDASRLHFVLSVDGTVVADLLWPEDAKSGMTVGPVDPAFAALWTGYRDALAHGTATLDGKGSVDGHDVYWLRFGSTGSEVAVDAVTFKPVVIRTTNGATHVDQRILVAETTAYHAADFTRRGPSPASTASSFGSSTSSGPIRVGVPPSTTVPSRWLTAGANVAGLELGSAAALTVTTERNGAHSTLRGYQLVYGPLVHGTAGPESTTVEELPGPDDPAAWRRIPAGSIDIQRGSVGFHGTTRPYWTGMLVTHGLYVTIQTPAGEHAVLAIARALHRG
jgi:hypothetical protein